MTDTSRRRSVIREIILNNAVATQIQLVRLLDGRGIRSTQASVSRDVVALGLVKVGGYYTVSKDPTAPGSLERSLSDRIHRIRRAGDNLVVLTTDPGVASIVALSLDRARWPFVTGTVAGDDTIFVACDGAAAQKKLLESLEALAPEAFL